MLIRTITLLLLATTAQEEGLNGRPDVDIAEACTVERRVLITLDLDFADIRAYPPEKHEGLIVLRAPNQQRIIVLSMIRRLLPALESNNPTGQLWVVDAQGIRIRSGDRDS